MLSPAQRQPSRLRAPCKYVCSIKMTHVMTKIRLVLSCEAKLTDWLGISNALNETRIHTLMRCNVILIMSRSLLHVHSLHSPSNASSTIPYTERWNDGTEWNKSPMYVVPYLHITRSLADASFSE